MCGGERGDTVFLGLCLSFLTGRTELLAEVENMAVIQSFTLGESGSLARGLGAWLPQEILVIIGVLRPILVHSEAYRGSLSSSLAELLELETISIC